MPDIVTYKCPACGAPLEFSAGTQSWKCEYCASEFNEQQLHQAEPAEPEQAAPYDVREEEPENEEFNQNARAYSCPSCGAQIVTDDTTAATFCMFCHNPTILADRLSGSFKPNQLIPFRVQKEQAVESFLKWSKKPLVPKDFRSKAQLEKITGMYIPFWLFDCAVDQTLNAKATRVRSWRSGNTQYTETSHFAISREAEMEFVGVPADGSSKLDDQLMDLLEPYDYKDIKDFSMSYLSGYFAEKYDQDHNQVFPRIRNRVDQYGERLLRDTINGYSSVTVTNRSTQYQKADARYTLLPLFLLTYKYKDKDFLFAMNGQTGKVVGKLPLCIPKALAWFGAIAAAVFVILLIGGMFL